MFLILDVSAINIYHNVDIFLCSTSSAPSIVEMSLTLSVLICSNKLVIRRRMKGIRPKMKTPVLF
jgi:hypothetical protein